MFLSKWLNHFLSGNDNENSESTNNHQAEQLKEQTVQMAYKKILQQSRFVELDGLNEYDENYSHFIPLGKLLTAEMRNALERLDSLNRQPQTTEELSALQGNDESGNDKA